MAVGLINNIKDAESTYQPLLLAKISWPDGTTKHYSTHSLSEAEGGVSYQGNTWSARILNKQINAMQALQGGGLSVVPSVTLELADPEKALFNLELTKGFKGAKMVLYFVLFDAGEVVTPTFSTDVPSMVKFVGYCGSSVEDGDRLLVTAVNPMGMTQVQLPAFRVQRRCGWIFPVSLLDRESGANDPSSDFCECGYSPDVSGPNARGNFKFNTTEPYTDCDGTWNDCLVRMGKPSGASFPLNQDEQNRRTGRFGGFQFNPPDSGGRSRSFATGKWEDITNQSNEAKYGDLVPLVYGTCWVDPLVLWTRGDANYTDFPVILCWGKVGKIKKVLVNDREIQRLAADNDTPSGSAIPSDSVTSDYQNGYWKTVTRGERDGRVVDEPYMRDSHMDTYGSVAVIKCSVLSRVADTKSVPRVRVLVQGPAIRVWYREDPGGATYDEDCGFWWKLEHTENPAWQVMDLLTWGRWRYTDFDIESFIDAAAYCDQHVQFYDIHGNLADSIVDGSVFSGQQYKRFTSSFSLRNRTSANQLITGVLNNMRSVLIPNDKTGKLKIRVKQTLADQQPSPMAGSNHNAAVPSYHADGTQASGYVAYRFDDSNVVSLGITQEETSQTPNSVKLPFQNRENEYSWDSLQVVDAEDVSRSGEVPGSFLIEGITNYDHAGRAVRVLMAESMRGNTRTASNGSEIGDTGGTLMFKIVTTFRAIHLNIGDICLVNCERKGVTDRLARVVSLSASTNAEYMTVGLMYHNDFWYFNSFGQEKQPIYRTPRSNALSRPPFPWAPYKEVPATGGAYFSVTERSFALKPTFQTAGDGSIYAKLMIGGLIPQNVMDETYSPPKLDFLASSSSTGGSFPGGKTFFIGISAKSASGSTYKLSKLSNVSRVAVPLGTNTNTITIHVPYWGHTAPPGFVVFVGESAETMTYQYEVDGQTPSTIVLNAAAVPTYNVKSWSAPDSEFNNFRFKVKKIRHAGVVGQEIVSVTSNSIKISMWTNHGFTVDQFAGHEVSVIGVKTLPDGSEVATPIADFPIVSNTADTLVVSGNPTTCVNGQSMKSGDVVVIRSRPTFGVDAIGSYVDDPDWVNALNYAEDGYTISSASNTTPIVATLAGVFPDWADGDTVIVQGVLGNTGANGCFAIASVNSAAKTLVLVGSAGTGESTSSGLIMRQIQGLIPDAERGNLIRFIKGTGRGTTVRIRSNTASRLYIDGAWPVTPDSSSRYIVEEPTWQFEKTTDAVNCDSPATEVWHELDVSNYRGEQLLVQAFTEDTGPTSSYDSLSPVREIFVFGRIGATSVSKVVYGNYTVTLYDEIILVDASSGPTTITLPGAVLVKGREYKVQKIDPTDNYVTIVGSDGDVINDQESAVLESQWQSVVLYAIGG